MTQPRQTDAETAPATTSSSGQSGADKRHNAPQAPLAFRVGVVGHRPNRLKQADSDQLGTLLTSILTVVKDEVYAMRRQNPALFDSAEPVLRAISPLAEGVDRLFAERALSLGFELCCVMPFARADFECDFTGDRAREADSLQRFRGLLSRAVTRFELDGCRADEGVAYGTAGRTLLNQSDLLVVVWDGERQGKRGGTEETFDEARRRGVPVVWIDAQAPHPWQILDADAALVQARPGERLSPGTGKAIDSLRRSVQAALALPSPTSVHSPKVLHGKSETNDGSARGLTEFYSERRPRWKLAVVWKAFRDIVADGKRPQIRFSVPPFEEEVVDQWHGNQSPALGRVVDRLRPYYAWPDKLAVVYADRYRSAFVLAFLLSAFAVGMALFPFGMRLVPHHGAETVCILFELSAILLILGLVFQGRRARWHERWIDYRLTAELVRHLQTVASLGGARPFPQVPAHWATYGEPGSTWMAWYVRSVERMLGLPSTVVNKDYLDACLVQLDRMLIDQIAFHRVAARRCNFIEERLHRFGIALLTVTLLACALHLVPAVSHDLPFPEWLPPLLTFICGFFPALGAALAGIINQGEFRRIEKRSESMREQLERLQIQIGNLRRRIRDAADPPQEQFTIVAAALAGDAARLLLNEVLDWRVVFLDRGPLVPPG